MNAETTRTRARQLSLYLNAGAEWSRWFLIAAGGFGLWVITAHLLPPEEVGRAGAVIAIMTLLSFAARLGVGYALIRAVPDQGISSVRLINSGLTFASLVAAVLSLGFLLFAASLVPGAEEVAGRPLRMLMFTLFIVAGTIDALQSFVFLAARKAPYSLPPSVLQLIVRAGILLLTPVHSAWDIVVSAGVAHIVSATSGFVFISMCYKGYRARPLLDWALLRGSAAFALTNHVANTALSLPDRLLPAVIAHSLGNSAAGFFYVAWYAGTASTQAATSLGVALFAEASHAPDAVRWLTARATLAGLGAALAGTAATWVLAGPILSALGPDYAENGLWLVRLLALSASLAIVNQLLLNMQRSHGRMRLVILVSIADSAVLLGVTTLLLHRFGLPAAAIGFAAAQVSSIALLALGGWIIDHDLLLARPSRRRE